MPFAHDPGPGPALHIQASGQQQIYQFSRRKEPVMEVRLKQSANQLIYPLAIPPAIHIGFAQPKGAIPEQAPEEPLIFNLEIPRPISPEPDIGRVQ